MNAKSNRSHVERWLLLREEEWGRQTLGLRDVHGLLPKGVWEEFKESFDRFTQAGLVIAELCDAEESKRDSALT